jgi:3-hydroxyisobutyrate dehydrogenase-like beta-hydroxyacid dehydrogenase
MTTITPATAKKLAALHDAHGSTYVEAPIFGVAPAVEARQAVFCLAGPAEAKARVRPLLEPLAARVWDFGDIGAGTATKLAGNFMIISGFAALQESFDALVRAGIDPKPTLEMLTTTLVATPGNQRYAGYLLSKAPVPTSGIPKKDLGLFEAFAGSAPMAHVVRGLIR